MIILIQSSNVVHLFSCAGFARPQLDVPCYQFIATCKKKEKVTKRKVHPHPSVVTPWSGHQVAPLSRACVHVFQQRDLSQSSSDPRRTHCCHRSQVTTTPPFPTGGHVLKAPSSFKIRMRFKKVYSFAVLARFPPTKSSPHVALRPNYRESLGKQKRVFVT